MGHESPVRQNSAGEGAVPAWGAPGHPDQIIFASDLVTVGAFRCPVHHPLFRNTGPIHQSCFVFPRTSVVIEHEAGPAFLADPTLVTMYNEGQIIERRAVSLDGDRCDWYGVPSNLLREMVRTVDPDAADAELVIRRPFARSSSALYLRQRRLFVRVSEDASRPEPIEVEETACSLVRQTLRASYDRTVPVRPTPAGQRRKSEVADAARRILARSFHVPTSLSAVAAQIGCSPFYLSRVFHEITGVTLHRYRTTLRLRASLELIEADRPLTVVALALGYSSHSHFTEAFRTAFGVPPSRAAVRQIAVS